MNNIIENWDDIYLGNLLYQYDNEVFCNLEKKIIQLCKKQSCIIDTDLMFYTFKYNNKIIDKFGVEVLFSGINNIVEYIRQTIDYDYEKSLGTCLKIKCKYLNIKNRIEFDKINNMLYLNNE